MFKDVISKITKCDLLEKSSVSLTGRIRYIKIPRFSTEETIKLHRFEPFYLLVKKDGQSIGFEF